MGGLRLRPPLHLHLLQRSEVCEVQSSLPSLPAPGHEGGMEGPLPRPVLLRQDLGRLRSSLCGGAAVAVGRQGETSSHDCLLTWFPFNWFRWLNQRWYWSKVNISCWSSNCSSKPYRFATWDLGYLTKTKGGVCDDVLPTEHWPDDGLCQAVLPARVHRGRQAAASWRGETTAGRQPGNLIECHPNI